MSVPCPDRFKPVREIHQSPHHRLLEASEADSRLALRLLRWSEETAPALDPAALLERMDSIAKSLELSTFAQLTEVSANGDTLIIAERFVSGTPIEGAEWSKIHEGARALIDDLEKLHAHHKWHGGVRPGRLLVDHGRITLTSFSFATWLSTSTSRLKKELEPDARLPPEASEGPKMAGPHLDVYGLSTSLLTVRGLPSALEAALQRGRLESYKDRPTVAQLKALL